METTIHRTAIVTLALVLLLMTALCGCGSKQSEAKPTDSVAPTESADGPDAESGSVREDGERFEGVITIEGMEEPVQLQHLRSETAGFEMDFDYEMFVRRSESDRECFVSAYDDPENPENYLEVAFCAENADAVEAAVSEALSKDYEILRQTVTLDGAGSCVQIDASESKGGGFMPDVLMDVYIIPAADGCRVATMRYAIEGAEGFGTRFGHMLNTLSVLETKGERSMSGEQALSAVKRYCLMHNPDLERIVNAGEYPVFWEIASETEAEIVILFRSYTGAEVRYYIDPVSGDTYVTEFVSGITPDEQRTDESINLWDYLDWWRS